MNDNVFIEDQYEPIEILNIEEISDSRKVYDLEVKDDSTYLLVNEIISHNSRAKSLSSLMKELTKFCGRYRCPFIFTNHSYKDVSSAPNPMYAKSVMKGGKQPYYMSSAVIFMSKKAEKDEDKNITGNILHCKSEKNRLAPEGQTANVYVSFKSGLNKYYGLIDLAEEAGLVEKLNEKTFKINHLNETLKISDIYGKRKLEVFNKDLLDKVDEYCQKKYTYSAFDSIKEDDEFSDNETTESAD